MVGNLLIKSSERAERALAAHPCSRAGQIDFKAHPTKGGQRYIESQHHKSEQPIPILLASPKPANPILTALHR